MRLRVAAWTSPLGSPGDSVVRSPWTGVGLTCCAARHFALEQLGVAVDLRPGNRPAGKSLDLGEQPALFRGDERGRPSTCRRSRGSTNPVNVIFGNVGRIEIHHMADFLDIQSSRRDVGGDQDAIFARAEALQGLSALAL